jgi:hypothetical protein
MGELPDEDFQRTLSQITMSLALISAPSQGDIVKEAQNFQVNRDQSRESLVRLSKSDSERVDLVYFAGWAVSKAI